VALLLVVFVPSQVDRLSDLQDSIALQEQLTADLHDLADSGAFDAACGPITVPDERAIPFLALWLDRDPSAIEPTEGTAPAPANGSPTGYFVIARTQNANDFFTLVPGEGARERVFIPKGTPRVASNDSWELYADCATGDER
jgi:hypothetical protein